MEFDEPVQVSLIPCTFCGRNFSKESISRHEGICRKTSRKRPVFNSSKQRDISVGESKYKPKNRTSSVKAPTRSQGNSNWRQKHEEFINTVKAARQVTAAIKQGRDLPPPPPPTINPDYVQCPHCMRRFNSGAAERHIPFCAEQAKRLSNKKTSLGNISNEAAIRASARQKYRPPQFSSGKKPASDGIQSAPASTTRGGQAARVNGASGISFARTASNSKYSSAQNRRGTIGREWDTSIEPAAARSDVRSKTGLKPSSGVKEERMNRSRRYSSELQQNRAKPTVRKVAGRSNDVSYPARKTERPRHDWSPDSYSTDSDDNRGGYNALAFDSQPRNGRMQGLNKSLYRNSFKPTNTDAKSSTQYNGGKNNQHGTHENVQSHQSTKENSDFYNWMKSAQAPEQASPAQARYEKQSNSQPSKFCHECGARYPIANAKFCCECGIKRIVLSHNV